jgi:carbamate kinase
VVSRSAIVAIGGNALIRAGERGTIPEQIANAHRISQAIVALLKGGLRIIITHGNGPQVGAALIRSERAAGQVYEQPLDVCVACTQGEIGYILQQALQHNLAERGMGQSVTMILTQMVVRQQDPAFEQPTKPIGPFYSEEAAEHRKRLYRWVMVEDSNRGFRRVVPSPEPIEVVEEEAIRAALSSGILVIAAGGGGIPVVRENGGIRGVDAVIDKDRASLLLASRLSIETLIFSTDADYIYLDYRKPGQRALNQVRASEMRSHYEAGHFPPGSMGPKVEAALRFLDNGGKEVIITSLDNLYDAIHGGAGTHILP